jgi:hypothetical protein
MVTAAKTAKTAIFAKDPLITVLPGLNKIKIR